MVSKAVLFIGARHCQIRNRHTRRHGGAFRPQCKSFFQPRRPKEKRCLRRIRRRRRAPFFCSDDDLRGRNQVLLPFSRSSLFSPGRPYYVIPASLTVDSEKTMSARHSARHIAALLLGVWVLAAAAPARADPFRFPWDPPAPVRQPARPALPQEQLFPQERAPLPQARLSARQVRRFWRGRGRK